LSGRAAKIGLVTLDLRFSSKIREAASKFNAEVLHVADPSRLPLDVNVVITSREESFRISRGTVLYRENFDSVEDLVEKAVEASLVGSSYKNVVIAIDPGKSMGAVYLLDNKVIKSRRYGSVEVLTMDVKKFIKSHEDAEKKYIVIGAASEFRIVKEILSELERNLRGEEVTTIVSDESFTSKGLIPKVKGMSKDEYSALILSLKNLIRLK